MSQSIQSSQLLLNVNILKGQVTKTAYQGVFIALFSIIIATLLVSLFTTGEISTASIIHIQRENYGLWVLYSFPFIFGFWGQYSNSLIVYQAGAMIQDQTNELRYKTIALEKQATHSSTHDLLTDLPNRSLFYDRVEQAILAANHHNTSLSILLLEIENYQNIYDTIGRISSDILLKQISIRLQGSVQNNNCIARIEGNTFGFLNKDRNQDIVQIARNIRQSMNMAFTVERLQVAVQTCIGIVNFPQHGEDVDTLVQKAGIALYIARNNKEGLAVYNPEFDQHSPLRLTLMSELRNAISRNELILYYQSKISLRTNSLYGAEALLRWNHPKYGTISPDEFIPMAKRTRSIQEVTKWVIWQTFTDCAKWHQQSINLTLSINLSANDLHDPDLPDLIAGIQVATNINPEWIMLEITEGSIMSDPEKVQEILLRLHNMGYKFSIDDFGTGYSSLVYLKKMPLSELKIDRSFVRDILNNESDAIIVNAIINLAHNLSLNVVAEGVEDAEIMAKLDAYDCDIIQGYFLNKPLPENEFSAWMQDSPWTLNTSSPSKI
ncbi:putative bifunctional diguanylate cyclase/phosphodiesterase [Methyloprofundus sp.]|uniref:putative bifunctional diguanylate cyclase/phosphodiesterase n=1 Tax=Methyloprofundus sp. TaxID=2020875 RepID=UPI003D0B9361